MRTAVAAPVEAELAAAVDRVTLGYRREGRPAPAREAYASILARAQVARDLETEGRCLVRLAFLAHHTGDFSECRLLLDRAAGVHADLARVGPVVERSIVPLCRGALAAIGGDYGEAVGWFDRAEQTAAASPGWAPLLTHAAVLAWLAFTAPDRDLGDLDALEAELVAGGFGTETSLVTRARVSRMLVRHQFAEAAELGQEVAPTVGNRIEQVRLLIPTAWGELWAGRADRAAETFARAAELARALDGRFLRTMALFGLAEADPARAADVLADAIADAGSGPMWDRLWSGRPPVRIEALGARRVEVGSRAVELRSDRADEVLFCVVLAGPRGIHWADLASQVWPGTIDPARAASNVSTNAAKARRALGSEGWRLRRLGPTLWFERAGVVVDVEALGRAPLPPGTVLLPGWEDRGWVAEMDRRRMAGLSGAA